jgi:hypothetical protein
MGKVVHSLIAIAQQPQMLFSAAEVVVDAALRPLIFTVSRHAGSHYLRNRL